MYFIVFEGIDGSGKTTQMLKTIDFLKDYKQIFVTKEPSTNKVGKYIKRLLKQDHNPESNALKYFNLYQKDREIHNKQIKKQLKMGNIVVCDRYYYSTLAYQKEQGLKTDFILEKSKKFIVPDLVFIIDVPEEVALKRLGKRGTKNEKFEKLEFLKKLRRSYLNMSLYGKKLDKLRKNKKKENIVLIDGNKKPDEVFEEVKKELIKFLRR